MALITSAKDLPFRGRVVVEILKRTSNMLFIQYQSKVYRISTRYGRNQLRGHKDAGARLVVKKGKKEGKNVELFLVRRLKKDEEFTNVSSNGFNKKKLDAECEDLLNEIKDRQCLGMQK